MCSKNSIYSEDFKWKVVQDVLSGTLTKEEARRVYSIKGNCTVLYWMRAFSGVKDYRSGGPVVTSCSKMAETKTQNEYAQEIARLKQELKRERMRADLWQKMIEVAEEELGVPIRKKFGAKQSPDADNG
jgi:transposase-like protein